MPKFLWTASYAPEGFRGVIAKGGTARQSAIEHMIKAAGGTLEAFYFAFGDVDAYVIADMPDEAAAAAVSMAINAHGVARVRTTPLLEASRLDDAAKVEIEYQPPGGWTRAMAWGGWYQDT